jgi:bifunctional oligoribonuclease and PAP phosphatase NrnA
MLPIRNAYEYLLSPRKIFLTTHHKPDGDAMGSMLGMALYLRKKGHSVTAVAPSEPPYFLDWLPGKELLINYEERPQDALNALQSADCMMGLDFNDFSRTKFLDAPLAASPIPKIMVDHHMFPKDVWTYGVSLPEKSSTCEMVFDFIVGAGDDALLDAEIASCLYTGTMTDTGSFRFPVTTPGVHRMVARLMETGMNHSRIHELVYDSWGENRMRFLGYVLMDRMQVLRKYNSAFIALSRKDMQLFNVGSGDTEGLVNYPLSIININFATLITERADEVKLSFRSKGSFDVNYFARTYFSGGGHFNAAGGRSALGLDETVARFKELLMDNHPKQ